MKLKFYTSINEAKDDLERGYKLKQIKEFESSISKDLESAGYKCKFESDAGFFIFPHYGYLAKLEVIIEPKNSGDNELVYSIRISNMQGENSAPLYSDKLKISQDEMEAAADDIAKSIVQYLVSALSINSEKLLEADSLKDKIAMLKADADTRKNTTESGNNVQRLFIPLLKKYIDEAFKGRQSADKMVTAHSSGNTIIINIGENMYCAAAAWKKDVKELAVLAISTPLMTCQIPPEKTKDSLNILLRFLSSSFGIQFKNIKGFQPKAEEAPAVEDEDNYLDKLKTQLGDLAGELFGESLIQESNRPSKSGGYEKYQNAWQKVNKETAIPLIKYFLYKETGLKDSDINTRLLQAIINSIQENGISPTFNDKLATLLNYYEINGELPKSYFLDVINELNCDPLVDLATPEPTIDKAIDGKCSLLYLKNFWDFSALPNDLKQLFTAFYNGNISTAKLQTIIDGSKLLNESDPPLKLKQMLGDKFSENSQELKKAILMQGDTFRPIAEIKKLIEAAKADVITAGKAIKEDSKKKDKDASEDTAEAEIEDEEDEFTEEETDEPEDTVEALDDDTLEEIKNQLASESDKKAIIQSIEKTLHKYPNIYDTDDEETLNAFKNAFLKLIKKQ